MRKRFPLVAGFAMAFLVTAPRRARLARGG
jgi:hypothetical protein